MAAVETSFDTLSQPVGKVLSSIKNTYDDGLAKSKREYTTKIYIISHIYFSIYNNLQYFQNDQYIGTYK